jgi:hypothetical protein
MKLPPFLSRARALTGILLIECLVYLGVFAILMGLGMAAFYVCSNHAHAVISATDNIASTLRAGERWRADIRAATGAIHVGTRSESETVRIPVGGKTIDYRFNSGEVFRRVASSGISQLLLPKVEWSRMTMQQRGGITAWRWELQLKQSRNHTRMPLVFTFEAVQPFP